MDIVYMTLIYDEWSAITPEQPTVPSRDTKSHSRGGKAAYWPRAAVTNRATSGVLIAHPRR